MFERLIRAICRSSARHPYHWLGALFLVSLPAVYEVRKIGLDTDLTRLLPEKSQAVRWTRELEKTVGDGGFFSILFEGDDPAVLLRAVESVAAQVAARPEVQSVDYRYPVEFVSRYRYLLVPSDYLQRLFDTLTRWKAEASPLGLRLDAPAAEGPHAATRQEGEEVQSAFERYAEMPEYHQSRDGRLMGMLVRPRKGVTSLGATRQLYVVLEEIAAAASREHGVWAGVSGTLRNKVDVYNQIRSDLNRSGAIATIGILLTLMVTFRSVRILPVVLLPIALGLLWSYGLVPTTVGGLNTITGFLLMVLLGMGVEYSLHLIKRYQGELQDHGIERSLLETYRSTGRSIVTSGLTTAFAMTILALSDFRGFSELGIISGCAMLLIFLAMFVALPPMLVVGTRLRLVRPWRAGNRRRGLVPPRWATGAIGVLVAAAAVLAARDLRFDYDFSNLQAEVPAASFVKEKHKQVYPGSLSPAALYVVRDVETLDRVLEILTEAGTGPLEEDRIGKLSSARNYVPDAAESARRLQILAELQDRLQGRWIRRVQDPERRRWIEDIRDFRPPERPATLDELPPPLRRNLEAFDGSGELLLGVFPVGERKNGEVAMAFTSELYGLQMPPGVRGPTGETPVFAEILWLVTSEGPWLVGLTLLGIFCLVLVDRKGRMTEALWILLPLICGLTLTLGLMTYLGWRLNFFNIVVLPILLGNTVDNGVHYYRRWREMGHDTTELQLELFEPVTGAAVTATMGYAGMVFANHAGLRSIGDLAVLGLACCWFSGVFLMPGLLRIRARQLAGRARRAAS
jgi:uncharacterized protein